MKIEEVLEKVYEPRRLLLAWQQVKRNAGAAGIDRMTIVDFDYRKKELFPVIRNKLKDLSYHFKPARRVEIPKEGKPGQVRKLGIPVIMDRIVSQNMNLALEEIFDPLFSESSFGFRKGRSQHQAIQSVKTQVDQGRIWCVSIDMKNFFDEIPHGLILKLIRMKIADERFVTLIARALKAGVIIDGKFVKTEKGSPQGSPMLSNIVLNELDHILADRKLNFCRWADDFVILLKSERAANRVKDKVIKYLEQDLGIPVNKEKSRVSLIKDVTFLGFTIKYSKIQISDKALSKFKKTVKLLTRRNNPFSMHQLIERLNIYLRGWISYFRIQEKKTLFKRVIDPWIRNRLRSIQLKKWKNPKTFQRMMIKTGYNPKEAYNVHMNMERWVSVTRRSVLFVLNNSWFRQMGLIFLNDFQRIA